MTNDQEIHSDDAEPTPVDEAIEEIRASGKSEQDPSDPESEDSAQQAAHREGTGTVAELELSLDSPLEETDSEDSEEDAVSRESQLVAQIESLQAEADANRDKWMRALAELENFRRRSRRDHETSLNLARADLLKQLLEVLDNFDRALDAFDQSEEPAGETYVKGVRLIQDQLLRVLRENGVERIEAVGESFDPNIHEAVSQVEVEGVPSQHVATVIKEGYRFNDTILRPAMVVVAQ